MNYLFSEDTKRIAIPQYVKITWDDAALNKFCQEIVAGSDGLGNVRIPLFSGCSFADAENVFATIPGKVKSMFPPEANIVVVGKDTVVPQPHKTITIHPGKYRDEVSGFSWLSLGVTPESSCHQINMEPIGEAGVYLTAIREYIERQYIDYCVDIDSALHTSANNWNNISLPLTKSNIADITSQVAVHECCHSMGLVPKGVCDTRGHNRCKCGRHMMDDGRFRTIPMRLGVSDSLSLRWILYNFNFLKQVFTIPIEVINE